MNENYDYANYISFNNRRRSDGHIFTKESFAGCEDCLVPLVWNGEVNNPEYCLGYCMLENRDEGVYAKCWFNDSENARIAKKLIDDGDCGISFSANRIECGRKGLILSGVIRAVHVTPGGGYTYETEDDEINQIKEEWAIIADAGKFSVFSSIDEVIQFIKEKGELGR